MFSTLKKVFAKDDVTAANLDSQIDSLALALLPVAVAAILGTGCFVKGEIAMGGLYLVSALPFVYLWTWQNTKVKAFVKLNVTAKA